MLYRHKFITNSSSTGFLAWGIIVPKWFEERYIPDFNGPVSVHAVKDYPEKVIVCIEDSMQWSSSDDDEGSYILQDNYSVEIKDGKAVAVCRVEIPFRLKEPPNKDYDFWERAISKFCKEKGIEYLKYMPKWQYVRYYQ